MRPNDASGSLTSPLATAKDPDSLQNVNISVISTPQCQEAYKTYDIKTSMLCLGIVPGRRQPCKVRRSPCLRFPHLTPCAFRQNEPGSLLPGRKSRLPPQSAMGSSKES